MKKLFAVLFCSFMVVGTVFADELSYEIDPVATAKAPWTVGERIVKDGNCMGEDYYREFLGVTQSGLALVQEFYITGEKLSDPFLKASINAGTNTECSYLGGVKGQYTRWYKSGQKSIESSYKNDELDGIVTFWYENGQREDVTFKNGKIEGLWTMWYENGQKRVEGNIKDVQWVGIWRAWDEKGNLIKEDDFGTLED